MATLSEILKGYEFLEEKELGFQNIEERYHLGEGEFSTRKGYAEDWLIRGSFKGQEIFLMEQRRFFKDENGKFQHQDTKTFRVNGKGKMIKFDCLTDDNDQVFNDL